MDDVHVRRMSSKQQKAIASKDPPTTLLSTEQ